MGKKILEEVKKFFKEPVTTLIEKMKEESYKVIAIKMAAVSVVIALLNVFTTIKTINERYDSKTWYSKEKIAEYKAETIKDADLFGTFLKQVVIFALVIAVLALILFIIAKLVKSKKEYRSTLALTTNTTMITTVGIIINFIFSFIYAPIGLIVLFATIIFSSYSQVYAFRESLEEVEDANKLVLVTTAVYTAIIIIATIIISSIIKSMLGDLASTTDITKILKAFSN